MLTSFNRGRYVFLALFLIIFSSVGQTWAFTYTQHFTPEDGDFTWEDFNSGTWDYSISESASSASAESGAIMVYAAAWCRSAEGWAHIYMPFFVPDYSSIKMTVAIDHVSEIDDMSLAEAEITWQMMLDGYCWRGYGFESASSADEALDLTITIITEVLGLIFPGAELALSLVDTIWNASSLAITMYEYSQVHLETTTRTFEFTVGPGDHEMGIGLMAHAAAAVAGTGYAILFGQITNVTLEITNDYDGPPDLVVSGISTGENEWRRGEQGQIMVTLANVGETPGYDDRLSLKICEPGETDYVYLMDDTGQEIFSLYWLNDCND